MLTGFGRSEVCHCTQFQDRTLNVCHHAHVVGGSELTFIDCASLLPCNPPGSYWLCIALTYIKQVTLKLSLSAAP
jgi:hypothetical protein